MVNQRVKTFETPGTQGGGEVGPAGGELLAAPLSPYVRARQIEPMLAASRPRLLRLARLRGVPPDLAEDVVQETMLEAWRCADRLYDLAGIDRWLDEICRNICRRHARKYASDQRHFPNVAAHTSDDERKSTSTDALLNTIPADDESDPAEIASREDMARLLDRALGLLPDGERALVEMCYLRELSQREAVERLGISLSALESRLHRARRHLRAAFNGPLRHEAAALDMALDDASIAGWHETRLWCTLCGRRHLFGSFLAQPDGSVNLHVRCPDCEHRYGLKDIDGNTVHSKGLIQLGRVRSFRPAWKRTMLGMAQRFTQELRQAQHHCPYCGSPASFALAEKTEVAALPQRPEPGPAHGLARHPYQFWVRWECHRAYGNAANHAGVFAASDLVYWSHAQSQQFMREHPRWVSEPELAVEYAGQPALRLQMADTGSASRLTLLADRQTLRILAVYP